jgi:hypothetical protein
MAGTGALMLHMLSFLGDSGFAAGTAALLFSVQAWASLVVKPLWGRVMRRVPPRFLGAGAFVCAGLALLGLLTAAAPQAEVLTAAMLALFGFAIGGTIPLQETVWASTTGASTLGRSARWGFRSRSCSVRWCRSSLHTSMIGPARTTRHSSSLCASGWWAPLSSCLPDRHAIRRRTPHPGATV